MSEAAAPDSAPESKPKKKKLVLLLAPVLLVALLLGVGGFFYFRSATASAEANTKQNKTHASKDKKKLLDDSDDHDQTDEEATAHEESDDAHSDHKKKSKDETAAAKRTESKKHGEAEPDEHAQAPDAAKNLSSAAASKASLSSALPDDEAVKQVVELQPFVVNLADTEKSRYLRLTVSVGIGGEAGEEEKPEPLFITRVRNAMLAVLSVKQSDDVLTLEGKKKLRKELLKAAQAASHHPEVLAIYITDFIVQL